MAETQRVVTELVIDARSAVSGGAQYEKAMDGAARSRTSLTEADQKGAAAQERAARMFLGYSGSLKSVASGYDRVKASVDPVFDIQRKLEQQLAKVDAAVRRGVTTEQDAANTIASLRRRAVVDLDAYRTATVGAGNASKLTSTQMLNLSRQGNDVVTMFALGISPMQIFASQAGQIVDALQQGPGGLTGALRGIGEGIAGLVTKFPLATAAIVAAGAAFAIYQATSGEKLRELDDILKDHEANIKAIKDAYGEAADGLKAYVSEARQISVLKEAATQIELQLALAQKAQEAIAGMGNTLTPGKSAGSFLQVSGEFKEFAEAIGYLQKTMREGEADVLGFRRMVAERWGLDVNNEDLTKAAGALIKLTDEAARAAAAIPPAETALEELHIKADVAASSFGILTVAVSDFNSALAAMAGIAAPALSETEEAEKALQRAMEAAGGNAVLQQQAWLQFETTMDRIHKKAEDAGIPIPTPRPDHNDIEAWDDATEAAQRYLDTLKSRADGLVEKFFPGEAARREAHELMDLLSQYGDQLDDLQRKAVEMRIDDQMLAAALGVRELSRETEKAKDGFDDLQREAENLKDSLEDAASSFLQDLFSGKDVLESIVSLGARFASMNFDKVVKAFGEGGFGKLLAGGVPQSIDVKIDIAPVVSAATKTITDYAKMGGVGAGLSAPDYSAVGKAIGESAAPRMTVGVSSGVTNSLGARSKFASLLIDAAEKVGTSARNLGAVIHYESGGRTDVWNPDGKHYGLIQFGPAERRKYAVAIGSTLETQFQAVVDFLKDRGFKPGMGLLDLYSTVNAGSPGHYNAKDGLTTVAQKVDTFGKHLEWADKQLGGKVEAGAKAGTAAGSKVGTLDAWAGLREVNAASPSQAASQGQTQGGGGFSVMGGLSSALGGFSMGYQSANPLMGGLGGALQGLAAGPWGAVIGGIAGLIGGLFGAQNKVRQAKRQLDKQMDQINALLAVGEGTGLGERQSRLLDYLSKSADAVSLAWAAKEKDLVERIHQSFNKMFVREFTDFSSGFEGMRSAYASGRGKDDPFLQGQSAVENLREELRAMIADVEYFGQWVIDDAKRNNLGAEAIAEAQKVYDAQTAAAKDAAIKMVEAFLDVQEPLSQWQEAIGSYQGAAAAMVVSLKELGKTSDEAAAIIDQKLTAALKQLATEFTDQLQADINEATDKGYLNDFKDLFKDLKSNLKDATDLGVDTSLVDEWFKSQAQAIVDSAQLTGEAFADLIKQFPQLEGVVHEFVEGAKRAGDRLKDYQDRLFAATTDTDTLTGSLATFDRAANRERESEIKQGGEHIVELEATLAAERAKIIADFAERAAERIRGYMDRYFAAINDTSTLAGQLAAFDRQAAQERKDEAKAGGEGLLALEKALQAERLKIIRDYAKQQKEEQERLLEDAQNFLDGLRRSLKEYVDGLKAGADSPLSPEKRLAEARKNYEDQYKLALGGDRDAANSLTSYSSDLLDAAKAYYGSTDAFQDIFNQIVQQLTDLPDQVSAEQFIVDELGKAIEEMQDAIVNALELGPEATGTVLGYYFDKLDENVDGLLTFDEIQKALAGKATDAQIQKMLTELDLNGDQQISKMEALLASMGITKTAIVDAIKAGYGATATLLLPAFDTLDKSVNGLLDFAELKSALGGVATDAELHKLFVETDLNGDAQLSKFELLLAGQGLTRSALVAAINGAPVATASYLAVSFKTLDTSVNGLLDFNELKAGLADKATDEEIAKLIATVDTNGDGQVSAIEAMQTALASAIIVSAGQASFEIANNFLLLDNTLDGLLDFNELQKALAGKATDQQIMDLIKAVDTNGDGTISYLEAITAATKAGFQTQPAMIAGLLQQYFQQLDTSVNGLLDFNELKAALGGVATDAQIKQMMTAMDANSDGEISKLEAVQYYTQATANQLDANTGVIRQLMDLRAITQEKLTGTNNLLINHTNTMVYYLNAIYTNQLRMINALNWANNHVGGPSYAVGGRVYGPGSDSSDSVMARLSRDEFVVRAQSARAIGYRTMEEINRGRLPMVTVPVAGGNDNSALIAEIRQLRAELAEVKRNTAMTVAKVGQAAVYIGEKVDENTGAVDEGSAEYRRQAFRKTG